MSKIFISELYIYTYIYTQIIFEKLVSRNEKSKVSSKFSPIYISFKSFAFFKVF